MTLAEKKFNLFMKDGKVDAKEIEAFFNENARLFEEGASVDVTVRTLRVKRRSTVETMTFALEAIIAESDVKSWKDEACDFDFDRGSYTYNGNKIYLTATEQAVLFRRLVLSQKPDGFAQAKYKLRQRFGEGFLKGVI